MKKTALFVWFLFCATLTLPGFSGDKFANWPQLKAFHTVMSETFHPSETGNLEPLKKRSGELVQKAKDLASAAIPKEFANKEVEAAVKKLSTDSQALDKLVQAKAADDVLKKSLSDLHDVFHTIVEKCQPNDPHHGHDHGTHPHSH
jgi:hypothetical protein